MYATQPYHSVSGVRSDRSLQLLIYGLYIAGFFTGVTAFAGVIIAHCAYRNAAGIERGQLRWQIRLFWWGAFALLGIGALHLLVLGFGAITGGFGMVFMVVPWTLTLIWTVVTLWAIVRGLQAALRGRAVAPGIS